MFQLFACARHGLLRTRRNLVGASRGKSNFNRRLDASTLGVLGVSAAILLESSLDHDNEGVGDSVINGRINSIGEALLRKNDFFCSCQSAVFPSAGTSSRFVDAGLNNETPSMSQKQQQPFRLKQAYEILELLGEGAYGMVYQARRKADGVIVALKTMPREFTGTTDFEREVAALQLLSKPPTGPHPHLVEFYDLHRDDKNYYLAMELIDGCELLDHLVDNGPYSEANAASFLRQFAEAMCYVHHAGLTHNDLKPENLMISYNKSNRQDLDADVDAAAAEKAELKVVDFGCARHHDLSRKDMQLPAQEFAMGCSFLHQAALGNRFELEKILKERPQLINFRDYDKRTALHIAASEGHVDICRYLISKGARINRSDRWNGFPLDDAHRHRHGAVVELLRKHGGKFGSTSQAVNLITAASEGDVDEVKALLDHGSIDLNQGDYDHRTALHLAANEGRLKIVDMLCAAGANVNVEDRWGNRPMDDGMNAKQNSGDIMNVLKKYGASANSSSSTYRQQPQQKARMEDLKKDGTTKHSDGSNVQQNGIQQDNAEKMTQLPAKDFAMGCSVLHQAALGNQFELEKILQERPSLVDFRDYDRRTALHIAASEGHIDICRYLVAKGARTNRSDRWGNSPLNDAHRNHHSDIVELLRKQGARFGSTSQATNFITAASEGDQEEVKALIEFGSIDLDQGDYDRRTALHLAAGEGQLEIVKMLCAAGANVNVEDRWGNRPMDDVIRNTKQNSAEKNDIMNVLKKYGAKPTVLSTSIIGHEATVNDSIKDHSPAHNGQKYPDVDHIIGTIAYSPPELFSKGATSTPAADMWAIGVIMFILLTGSHPFDKYADKTDDEIKETVGMLSSDNKDSFMLLDDLVFDERIEGLSESCVELMRNLMHPDPDKRITSDSFLRHPWTQGLTASWKTMENTRNNGLRAYWQEKFRSELIAKYATKNSSSSGETMTDHDMKKIFEALKPRNGGVLGLKEITLVFEDLGYSEENIRAIFTSIDLDGTGCIHWDEFQALMRESNAGSTGSEPTCTDRGGPGLQVNYLQQRFKTRILNSFIGGTKTDSSFDKKKLREIFNAIDLEGNGFLDLHEIRVVLRSAGEPEDVISRIVASLDLNRDGGVTWDEFVKIMKVEEQ